MTELQPKSHVAASDYAARLQSLQSELDALGTVGQMSVEGLHRAMQIRTEMLGVQEVLNAHIASKDEWDSIMASSQEGRSECLEMSKQRIELAVQVEQATDNLIRAIKDLQALNTKHREAAQRAVQVAYEKDAAMVSGERLSIITTFAGGSAIFRPIYNAFASAGLASFIENLFAGSPTRTAETCSGIAKSDLVQLNTRLADMFREVVVRHSPQYLSLIQRRTDLYGQINHIRATNPDALPELNDQIIEVESAMAEMRATGKDGE